MGRRPFASAGHGRSSRDRLSKRAASPSIIRASLRSITWTSPSKRARSMCCSARTARANPLSFRFSPGASAPNQRLDRNRGRAGDGFHGAQRAAGLASRRCSRNSPSSLLKPSSRIWSSAKSRRSSGSCGGARGAGGREALFDALERDIDLDRSVSQLSRGEQQLVEIAKAMRGDLRVLILDEPTASLTDRETEILFGLIARLKARGVGVIYISHRIHEFERDRGPRSPCFATDAISARCLRQDCRRKNCSP